MPKGPFAMFEALWGWPPPVLDPAGPYADSVTVLAWVLFAMGMIVTGIVAAAIFVAVKGSPAMKAKLGGEKSVWIGGIAFPGIILTVLLVWGLTLTHSLSSDITGEEMRVRITGEMWWFRVQYLDDDGNVILEDANELRLPVGVPVVLELRSADVIHSFWVPNLSGKKDMVPGRTNLLRLQADRAGQFGGICAEYCGGPHALMGFATIATAPADWKQWMDGQRAAAAGPARGDAGDPGRALFMESGCGACHRVAGTEANGMAGPDLTHVGSRVTLGAGILPNHRGTLMGWIGDAQSIKPGNRMPSYSMLSAEELEQIAAWLEQQT